MPSIKRPRIGRDRVFTTHCIHSTRRLIFKVRLSPVALLLFALLPFPPALSVRKLSLCMWNTHTHIRRIHAQTLCERARLRWVTLALAQTEREIWQLLQTAERPNRYASESASPCEQRRSSCIPSHLSLSLPPRGSRTHFLSSICMLVIYRVCVCVYPRIFVSVIWPLLIYKFSIARMRITFDNSLRDNLYSQF